MLTSAHRRGERGQVLPIWVVGTIATLAVSYLLINYANFVRYQIRAQNTADSMAQLLITPQTEYLNKMEALLYASNVEEYRIRTLLDGMLLAINGSGGCLLTTANTASTTAGTCNRVYSDLSQQYNLASQRYTADILMLDSVTLALNQANVKASGQYVMSGIGLFDTCGHEDIEQKFDCKIHYKVDGFVGRTNLLAVNHDAATTLVPGMGRSSSAFGLDTENASLFAPVEVDVVTCAYVPPIIPSFGPFKWPTYFAVGRGAATAAQIEQDYLQPGMVCDPTHTGNACGTQYANFQPPEDYTPTTLQLGSYYNWYQVYYGGNPMTANASVPAFQGPLLYNEFSVMMGWWAAIPIAPFGPTQTVTSACT